MNGGKYTKIQRNTNTKDRQIQSGEASVIEEDENIEINNAHMSLHEREICSESLRSEVTQCKISWWNNDNRKLTKTSTYWIPTCRNVIA